MDARALTYPLSTVLVPAVWWLWYRRRPFPYDVDVLLVLPFLVDTAGNALDLYDSVEWWDDANHVVNWALLVLAFGALLRRLPVGALAGAGLALGFGAVTHILWELGEYVAFIRDNPDEFRTAYTDTLGDMALSLARSAVAATAVWLVLRRSQPPGVPTDADETRASA